jgi:hypothetical protein
MAGSNSNIQITDLDFSSIKTNLIDSIQSFTDKNGNQPFKDYNFTGSGLNVLMDILAYNTQYNAYYLNMIANEMFLDSAVQRSSVVSQAKLLNYTPKSAIAPSALVNVTFTGVTDTSLTLPAYSNFLSSAIDGVNYNFVNPNSYTVNTSNNTVTFTNVEIKQGIGATYSYTVNSTTNPSYTFEIPDSSVDTTTLKVLVQQSSSNSSFDVYNLADNYLSLNDTSKVYFLQESLNGNYQVYFGDGIVGKKLTDGNIVILNYLSTEGTGGAGANSFTLMNTVSGYAPSAVISVSAATQGGDKESINSIKFQAPKSYAAQGRAVTKEDYITAIQQNNLGIAFDAVNVWGGEENSTPVYGQVFICLKPQGSYNLTATQKQRIIQNVINPISVLTVTPTIVDPDYTYLKLTVNIVYDPNKTTQTAQQIENGVKSAIQTFANNTLNTFNSTFSAYDMLTAIQNYSSSILSSDFKIQLQKKFFPNLKTPTTYTLNYNTPLEKGILLSGVSSLPPMKFRDPLSLSSIIDGVFIEEVPANTNEVESISILNPGYGYTATPKVTILGDGTGATAHAVVIGQKINSIVLDTPGTGYTSAIAVITNDASDTTGALGAATVNLAGRYGTLRSYYNNTNSVKTILNNNLGVIDYSAGTITLNSFTPYDIDNDLGQLTITANPTTSIISSAYNRIITVDSYDPSSIIVNVTSKTS